MTQWMPSRSRPRGPIKGSQDRKRLDDCVEVVVNDRGPYTGGRDLDLSEGAAQAIGLTDSGVAVVQVSVGSEPGVEPPMSVLPDTGGPQWMALASGVLLVITGLLLRRRIR